MGGGRIVGGEHGGMWGGGEQGGRERGGEERAEGGGATPARKADAQRKKLLHNKEDYRTAYRASEHDLSIIYIVHIRRSTAN